ncbi:hypothetical protein BHE74_00056030 [Ensete ventricosum]|nr:hypothetical protein BHE74_00056030 [Ensete ventricosum]
MYLRHVAPTFSSSRRERLPSRYSDGGGRGEGGERSGPWTWGGSVAEDEAAAPPARGLVASVVVDGGTEQRGCSMTWWSNAPKEFLPSTDASASPTTASPVVMRPETIPTVSSLLKSCARPSHLKQAHARIPTILSASSTPPSCSSTPSAAPPPSSSTWLSRPAPSETASTSLSASTPPSSPPDKFTFPFALRSCAALSVSGCSSGLFVAAALVDMYSKWQMFFCARQMFDKMASRDLVCWTSMISGYAHNGLTVETLDFFQLMQLSSVKPNRVSLLSSLACGCLGALRGGGYFHCLAIKTRFKHYVLVATAVIDMHAKCGSLELARLVFDRIDSKNVVCWSMMVASFRYHGLAREAISTFDNMVDDGVMPNAATFTSLLSACSHSGLSEEGRRYFDSMNLKYGIEPKMNHSMHAW